MRHSNLYLDVAGAGDSQRQAATVDTFFLRYFLLTFVSPPLVVGQCFSLHLILFSVAIDTLVVVPLLPVQQQS